MRSRIERLPNGHYWLGVHIADVSHYVQEGSALDEEAYERGTSVYFTERAVHMFPHELATGLCSLNPHVDRLVQSCLMEVDRRGHVVRYEMHDGVINSDERMTYTDVNAILTGRDDAADGARQYARAGADVRADARALRDAQRRAGAGAAPSTSTCRRPRSCSSRTAQIDAIVAERAQRRAPPHRGVHAAGQRDGGRAPRRARRAVAAPRARGARHARRWPTSRRSSRTLGYSLAATGRALKPKHFQRLIDRMKRHAGGAADRGADAAHDAEGALRRRQPRPLRPGRRALHALHVADPPLSGPGGAPHAARSRGSGAIVRRAARREELAEELPETARHTSEMERRADDAERELLQWKKVRFMADKVGDEYEGFVTGVAPFGLFVELIEHYVEGLVHVSSMADDYYRFVEQQHVLYGENTKKTYRLGDKVRGAGGARGPGAPADRSGAGGDPRGGARRAAGRGRCAAGSKPRSRSAQRPGRRERAAEREAATSSSRASASRGARRRGFARGVLEVADALADAAAQLRAAGSRRR